MEVSSMWDIEDPVRRIAALRERLVALHEAYEGVREDYRSGRLTLEQEIRALSDILDEAQTVRTELDALVLVTTPHNRAHRSADVPSEHYGADHREDVVVVDDAGQRDFYPKSPWQVLPPSNPWEIRM
jgi:hypothetical protein